MNVSGFDSNSIGILFSGFNQSKSTTSVGMGIDLSTYGLIRSGSYGKLLKAYYATGTDATGVGKAAETTTSTSKDSAKVIAAVESTADDLAASAKALYTTGSKSLFEKKSVTDSEGKTTEQYDMDAIYKAVNSFVEDFNSAVSAAGKSNATSIANAGASMVNNAKYNSKLLGEVGIKIDSTTQQMSIDEDTFKKADMTKVKSLFSGNGSFAYSTAVKASMLKSNAQMESAKSNTYGKSGNYTYNYSTGELYRTDV